MVQTHIVVVSSTLNNLPNILPIMIVKKNGRIAHLWFDREAKHYLTDNKEMIFDSLKQDIENGIFNIQSFAMASMIITNMHLHGLIEVQ